MDTAARAGFTTVLIIVLLPAAAPLTLPTAAQSIQLLTASKSATVPPHSTTCSASLHSGFAAAAKVVGSLSVHAATKQPTGSIPLAIRSSLEAKPVSVTIEQQVGRGDWITRSGLSVLC